MKQKQEPWLPLSDLYKAYIDCKKRKRNTHACAAFERHEATNLMKLYRALNNGTYEIGFSNAFCVTRPKLREVFAADFPDRIVHHLLIMKTLPLFENYFIPDSYNCRVGKGTLYGHKRLAAMAKLHPGEWILCIDLKNFFCSIPKQRLADQIEAFLRKFYNEPDKDHIIKLTRQVILHKPQDRCIKKGNLRIFEELPREKSLFTCDPEKGMAIGNLTSQIYANFYLTEIDRFIVSKIGPGRYGRYVDDLRIIGTRDDLLKLLPEIREKLTEMGLELHPKKWELQPIHRGFNFIGGTIKPGRMYTGNRTVGNFQNKIRLWNKKDEKWIEENIEKIVQSYNSYCGFMVQYKSFGIRKKLWKLLSDKVKKFTYLTNHMSVLRVRNKYKQITKLKEKYYDPKLLYHKLRKAKKSRGKKILGKSIPKRDRRNDRSLGRTS